MGRYDASATAARVWIPTGYAGWAETNARIQHAGRSEHDERSGRHGWQRWQRPWPARHGAPEPPAAESNPIALIVSQLGTATPDQQRVILGEALYPLVDAIDSANAAKVTGMLLEMDQAEVLHLIESADALKAKVQEALAVLAAAE